jgi:hypothetical protein
MPQRPLGERTYSRSPRIFSIIEGRAVQPGEAEPGWLWRTSKERLMLVPSTRQRFTDLRPLLCRSCCHAAGNAAELAAKATTSTVPIEFAVVTSPSSLASWPALHAAGRRPASIDQESDSKRLWGHNRPSEPLLWALAV